MRVNSQKRWIICGILLTMINVVLIWVFRFLPMYDYPIWLFEVKVLQELVAATGAFSDYYKILPLPVPNLGFLVPVWGLSHAVPVEVAGKLFLSLCVAGFPWSFWYCVRALSDDPNSGMAWLGFPYSFNLFIFGGHAYLLGISMAQFAIGYFLPRILNLSRAQLVVLSTIYLSLYLVHALAFCVTALILVAATFAFRNWKKSFRMLVVLIPSAGAALWYVIDYPFLPAMPSHWGLWTIAQNLLKPTLLLTKSYGILSPVPLTLVNVMWCIGIGGLFLWRFLSTLQKGTLNKPLIFVAVLFLCGIIFFPDPFLGITQPGSRLTLPLILVCALLVGKRASPRGLIPTLLMVTFLVSLHNLDYFRRVDKQMSEMFEEYVSSADVNKSFIVIRLDWPAASGLRDVVSASINPLFGVPYYAHLQGTGWGGIHETSLLQVREEHVDYALRFSGETPDDLAASVGLASEGMKKPANVTIVGRNNATDRTETVLQTWGFRVRHKGSLWTILQHLPEGP